MSAIAVVAWAILAMHMAVCLAHDLPLINGTSIVLLQNGGMDVSEPEDLIISPFTGLFHWKYLQTMLTVSFMHVMSTVRV